MLAALIKQTRYSDIALRFEVVDISDIEDKKSLEAIRRFTNSDYALFVNNTVKIGMAYDPETGIIYDDKHIRVYPPQSSEERLVNLDKAVKKLTFDVDIYSPDISISDAKDYLIRKNKNNLENYLYEHPLVRDGKVYTVTSDKQNQLTGLLNAYNYAKSIGVELSLSWNETGKTCQRYSYEDLVQLYLTMLAYVKPIVTYQQEVELDIRSAGSKEEAAEADIYFTHYTPPVVPSYESTVESNAQFNPLPEITPETESTEQVSDPVEGFEEILSEEIPNLSDPSIDEDNQEEENSEIE